LGFRERQRGSLVPTLVGQTKAERNPFRKGPTGSCGFHGKRRPALTRLLSLDCSRPSALTRLLSPVSSPSAAEPSEKRPGRAASLKGRPSIISTGSPGGHGQHGRHGARRDQGGRRLALGTDADTSDADESRYPTRTKRRVSTRGAAAGRGLPPARPVPGPFNHQVEHEDRVVSSDRPRETTQFSMPAEGAHPSADRKISRRRAAAGRRCPPTAPRVETTHP
jgi:hypothetical protein